MPTADPVDVLTWAAESRERDERVRGYRRALELSDALADQFESGYLASARARALAGLARDGAGTPHAAVREASKATRLGEPCAAQHAIAEMWFALGEFEQARSTIIAIPRSCFRSNLMFIWRFRLWNLRVYACFRSGRYAEALRFAEAIVDRMSVPGDPLELVWAPPTSAVDALLALRDGSAGPRAARRADGLLLRLADGVDLDDWFERDLVERLRLWRNETLSGSTDP